MLGQELGGLGAKLLHLADDLLEQPVVVHGALIDLGLRLGDPAGDGSARAVTAPLPVGAVELRGIRVAATAGNAAVGVAKHHAAPLQEVEIEDPSSQVLLALPELFEAIDRLPHCTHGREILICHEI